MAVATPKPNDAPAPFPDGPAKFRFSTDELPARDRLAIMCEVVGHHVTRQEIEPLADYPLRVRTTAMRLPGFFVYWSQPSPVRMHRTRPLLSDGNSDLLLQWANCPRSVQHLGRDVVLRAGEGMLFSCADTRSTVHRDPSCETIVLSVPRASLNASLRRPDASLATPIPADSGPLSLLLGYLRLLRDQAPIDSGAYNVAAAHVCDLLALTLGATRDAAWVAENRGARAARLEAVKQAIRENLPQVTLADIAAWQRLSPRYVQKLFEENGTTFTEFVLDERLSCARRMLASPRSAGRKISDVAYNCGFGDVSYFNRRFRARFGATPGEMREP